MVRYVCTHCKYRCEMKNPSECPYCGRATLEKERSASELLDEVEGILEE